MEKLQSITTAYLNPDERKKAHDSLYKTRFKSGLKVFSDHNGFINGEFHTFVGTKGSGKSTWSKTICSEIIYQNKTILLYISEERKDKYVNALNENMARLYTTEEELEDAMSNIIIVSEMDSSINHQDQVFRTIKELCEICEVDLILFDNFTTSFLAELPIMVQSEVLRRFKKMADVLNIPVLVFFHTAKLYDPKRLDGDNVRGSATAINIGSYNYVIAQHKDGSVLRNFIFTEKARYHSKANKKFYEMTYDNRVGLFTECKDYYQEDFVELVSGKGKKSGGKGFE